MLTVVQALKFPDDINKISAYKEEKKACLKLTVCQSFGNKLHKRFGISIPGHFY